MKQYEYKFLPFYSLSSEYDERRLNQLASKGWKVISVSSPPSDARQINLILEREVDTSNQK